MHEVGGRVVGADAVDARERAFARSQRGEDDLAVARVHAGEADVGGSVERMLRLPRPITMRTVRGRVAAAGVHAFNLIQRWLIDRRAGAARELIIRRQRSGHTDAGRHRYGGYGRRRTDAQRRRRIPVPRDVQRRGVLGLQPRRLGSRRRRCHDRRGRRIPSSSAGRCTLNCIKPSAVAVVIRHGVWVNVSTGLIPTLRQRTQSPTHGLGHPGDGRCLLVSVFVHRRTIGNAAMCQF